MAHSLCVWLRVVDSLPPSRFLASTRKDHVRMLLTSVRRSLQSSFPALLLLAAAFSCTLTAFAQGPTVTVSPALVTDGGSVTLSTSVYPIYSVGFTISGLPAGTKVTQQSGNGMASITASPVPAGLYEVTAYISGNNQPSELSFYSLQVFGKGGSAPAALQGQYAVQLSGQASNFESGPHAIAAAGSITADGKGNITAGILDLNTPAGVEAGVPVTGTYQFSAYGNGTINLATAQGTLQLAVQGIPLFGPTLVQIMTGLDYANPASTFLNQGVVATTAGGLASVTGTLLQTDYPQANSGYSGGTPVLPMLNGTFPASLTGEQSSTNVALAGALQFQFTSSGTVTSRGTIAGDATTFDFSGLTGKYTQFDPTTGRTTFTLTNPTQPSAAPQSYAAYQVAGGNAFFFVSTSPRADVGLLAGKAGSY